MRDRLIQLIMECNRYTPEYSEPARLHAEFLAQHLLNNNVIVTPVKVGDKAYCIWQYSDFDKEEHPFIQETSVVAIVIDEGVPKIIPENYGEMTDTWHQLLAVAFTKDEAEKELAERSENGT